MNENSAFVSRGSQTSCDGLNECLCVCVYRGFSVGFLGKGYSFTEFVFYLRAAVEL